MLMFFSACEKAEVASTTADDYFYLQEAAAKIPIWVRGNTASNKILLYIQGGPGLNTMDFATVDYPGWEETLENDVAIAYFDQRGTGNAQGNFELNTVTLDQYLVDIHKIVQLLQNQYPDAEIYLFGHSFGGWLSYLYGIEYAENPATAGIISVNAPFTKDQDSIQWIFRHEFLVNVAEEKIQQNEAVGFWTEALNWADAHPVIETQEERQQWNDYIIEGLGQYEFDPPLALSKVLKAVFLSSVNIFPTLFANDRLNLVADQLFSDPKGNGLLFRLDEFQLPLLMITGRYDDIAPPEELEYALPHLPESTQLVVLPEAGHSSFLNQPELFRAAINEFLQ